jgi:hypothetical protein
MSVTEEFKLFHAEPKNHTFDYLEIFYVLRASNVLSSNTSLADDPKKHYADFP